jgi:general L-amino acid transport system permease protein
VKKDPAITTEAELLPSEVPFWRNPEKRAIVFQIVALLLVAVVSYYLYSNTQANLERQSIATGFGFLDKEASFEIGESVIDYSAADSYADALLVGALNTVKVSFIGILFTLVLGTIVGVARLSSNWLVSKIAAGYIEIMQNIPVLLQLFFWYAIFYESFPSPRQALKPFEGVFLCNRGLIFGVPEAHTVHATMGWAFIAALAIGWFLNRWGKKKTGTNRADLSCDSRHAGTQHRVTTVGVGFCWRPNHHGHTGAERIQFHRWGNSEP